MQTLHENPAPQPVAEKTSSALSLAAITAGAIGAALLVIAVASILAMLSLGTIWSDEAEGITIESPEVASEDTEAQALQKQGLEKPAEPATEKKQEDSIGHFFDALYREDFMSTSKAPD